jgi:hypothetical protein
MRQLLQAVAGDEETAAATPCSSREEIHKLLQLHHAAAGRGRKYLLQQQTT